MGFRYCVGRRCGIQLGPIKAYSFGGALNESPPKSRRRQLKSVEAIEGKQGKARGERKSRFNYKMHVKQEFLAVPGKWPRLFHAPLGFATAWMAAFVGPVEERFRWYKGSVKGLTPWERASTVLYWGWQLRRNVP